MSSDHITGVVCQHGGHDCVEFGLGSPTDEIAEQEEGPSIFKQIPDTAIGIRNILRPLDRIRDLSSVWTLFKYR